MNMTDSEHKTADDNFNEPDSRADAIAFFCLVMIAVGTMIYLAAG